MYVVFKGIYGSDKDAVKIEGGIIRELLCSSDIPKDLPASELKRLDGYAYPGFNDSHMHLVGLGKKLSLFSCVDCKSRRELADGLLKYIESGRHRGGWLLGRGWNQDLFDDGSLPTKEDIDRASKEIPIAVHRTCGHIAVLNSAALRASGLCDESGKADIELVERIRTLGGEIDMVKDSDGRETLEPTGIIRENAASILIEEKYSEEELRHFVLKAQEYLVSLGITSVQTDDLYFAEDWRDMVRIFEELEAEGALKLRVYEQSQIPSPRELLDEYVQCKDGSDKRFKLGPLKIVADGSLGARTAFMTEPYHDNEPGSEDNLGMMTLSEERLEEMIFAAAASGTDAAIHGIGDGTIEVLIRINEELKNSSFMKSNRLFNAMAKPGSLSGLKSLRNTIIHCQVMSFEQVERMAKIGLDAMVQPIFLDYDLGIIESRVGSEKAKSSYAYRTMLDSGIRLSFGSDAPVEDPNPLRGMHFAVNRKTEAIMLDEAIDAYTKEGAYFSYEEDVKGEIAEGMFADIAVVRDRLTPENLLKNKNLATIIGGEIVYMG